MGIVYHAPISNALLEALDIPFPAASFGALVNGAGVDMRGWDAVAALVVVTSVTATGTWQATLQQADDSGFTLNVGTLVDAGTGAPCQTPAAQTATGMWWLEAYRPTRRYVRTQLNPLVANVAAGALLFRYRHTGLLPVNARDALALLNRVTVRAS